MKLKREELKNISREKESIAVLDSGTVVVSTGEHTGRSPNAKKIVIDEITAETVDWKNVSGISKKVWAEMKEDFLASDFVKDLYVQDVYAGHRNFSGLKVKIHTELAWHSIFALNMFEEIEEQEDYDFMLYYVPSFTQDPNVIISFEDKMILITGTMYAGEMKKSVFTILNHLLPEQGIFPMHCSINLDSNKKNPTIFFGLSGTGKTTLSADSDKILIGDDEHGWSTNGVFNFENGCYAKVINLDEDDEPEIWEACQGQDSILENVVVDESGNIDFFDKSKTENTRSSYPLSYIKNSSAKRSSNLQPTNVILLTCDAFSILPAIARLTPDEAWKFFVIGYTSKVAGTEKGITEPVATFSPCFGLPFMTRDPKVYADMLKSYLEESGANCWMLNTGWTSGPYGIGDRISITDTRDILSKIYDGSLAKLDTFEHAYTRMNVPKAIDVDLTLLKPELGWSSLRDYDRNCSFLLNKMVDILQR
jgi:phosphoenolpyruvate carboxykinase (ATP)